MNYLPSFQLRNSRNQISNIIKMSTVLFFISVIVGFFTINWHLFYVWSALQENYQQDGLTFTSKYNFRSIFWYWTLHHSPMHLFYVFCLFGLGQTGRDISLRQSIFLITIVIFLLPFIIWINSYIVALILAYFGSSFMVNALTSKYYIGASHVAWSIIGISNRKDVYVIIAFLFPFCYKIFISGVLDFTPDIAHLTGFVTGYLIVRMID